MNRWIYFYFFLLFYQTFGQASQPPSLFTVNPVERGTDIYNLFKTLSQTGQVVLQTAADPPFVNAPYIGNSGVIPYVKQMVAAPNFTLFIVAYQPSFPNNLYYVVVGVEQIVELVYYPPQAPLSQRPAPFSSSFAKSNVLPFYWIDPVLRAQDIASIITTLNTNGTYNTASSQVALQTTLSGPFYPNFNSGLIPNVTKVSTFGSLLQVEYQTNMPLILGSVMVAAEQVLQIVYYAVKSP